MSKIRTAKGAYIDTADYIKGDEIAIGNMKVNARGDKIDSYGNVIQSAKEIAEEFHTSDKVSKIKTIPLSELSSNFFMTLEDVVAQTEAAKQSSTVEELKSDIKKKK
jgi:hypothetical protein